MSKVTVVIPSRKEPYLKQTVECILRTSSNIELYVVLDGYKPIEPLPEDKRLKIIQSDTVRGMKAGINAVAAIAKGKYLMKIDAHCQIGEGWDEILQADCEDNWITVPRRYWLDAPNWQIMDKECCDMMYYIYPFTHQYLPRMTCRPWYERARERKDILIDEDMGFQGSLWFMHLKHYQRIGGLTEFGYGTQSGESEELALKTQLGPWQGAVMRNKKTWYAHWAKPNTHWRTDPETAGRITDEERDTGFLYAFDYWWNNRWEERVHDFQWLIDRFAPLPRWPEDWRWRTAEIMKNITDHNRQLKNLREAVRI
jgi:glycosyltransferase involved in cell wall biosynthesis